MIVDGEKTMDFNHYICLPVNLLKIHDVYVSFIQHCYFPNLAYKVAPPNVMPQL